LNEATNSHYARIKGDATRAEAAIIESMFDTRQDAAALVERMRAASRAEHRAAGERLAAIGALDVCQLRECGERETWSTDTWDAICAERWLRRWGSVRRWPFHGDILQLSVTPNRTQEFRKRSAAN
jgi:hypothetical protein